jgi:PPOX class F420-dependent enzyme/OxyR family protein
MSSHTCEVNAASPASPGSAAPARPTWYRSACGRTTEEDTIDVTGRDFEKTKKFPDVALTGRAAIVIDDLASVDPWHPRGIEVRGRAEAIDHPRPLIRIHPDRVRSWGLRGARLVTRVVSA